jgi:hypothetical protein
MSAFKHVLQIIDETPSVTAEDLETFLEPFWALDLADLAQMPGTPATVLCAQFLHYAKSHNVLAEALRRDDHAIKRVQIWLRRLRAVNKRQGEEDAKDSTDS